MRIARENVHLSRPDRSLLNGFYTYVNNSFIYFTHIIIKYLLHFRHILQKKKIFFYMYISRFYWSVRTRKCVLRNGKNIQTNDSKINKLCNHKIKGKIKL